MANILRCPTCGRDVTVTQIKIKEKVMYKYVTFSKVVGMCPECTSDIHLPEFDNIITRLQNLNKSYVTAANNYTNASDISKDNDFSKNWDDIPRTELAFETVDSTITQKNMSYNGTLLKTDIGYDVVNIESKFQNRLNEIKEYLLDEEQAELESYNFKTYIYLNNVYKQICCTMWKDISNNVSGLLYNTDDTTSYRYAKQKSKNKEII